MKAIALTRYLPIDDPQSLQDVELPKPVAGGSDVLVRVEAISVNPVDTKIRSPKPQVEAQPKVLGYDAAGVVEAVGEDVTLFQPGDEVYYAGDVTRSGTNAQFHLVDERLVGRKPATLDFAQAAALPLTAVTAWELLFDRMPFSIDAEGNERSLLVIGGAGGVGSIATQLARHAGFTVIATASRAGDHRMVQVDGRTSCHRSSPATGPATGIGWLQAESMRYSTWPTPIVTGKPSASSSPRSAMLA